MATPQVTAQQRAAAVAKSAETRRARAAMLQALTAGQASLTEVLDRPDPVARKTRVRRVLQALPGYGPATVAAVMATAGIAANRRLGGLGPRQRSALIHTVTHRTPPRRRP